MDQKTWILKFTRQDISFDIRHGHLIIIWNFCIRWHGANPTRGGFHFPMLGPRGGTCLCILFYKSIRHFPTGIRTYICSMIKSIMYNNINVQRELSSSKLSYDNQLAYHLRTLDVCTWWPPHHLSNGSEDMNSEIYSSRHLIWYTTWPPDHNLEFLH
jgi:hypothetical protein